MIKRAFQALKRMCMHVSGLPPTYLIKKKLICNLFGFFNQKMVEEDLRHA